MGGSRTKNYMGRNEYATPEEMRGDRGGAYECAEEVVHLHLSEGDLGA